MDYDLLRRCYAEYEIEDMDLKQLKCFAYETTLTDLYAFNDEELVEEIEERDPAWLEEFRSKTQL